MGIFSPKSDEVTGDWRKLHNEELHNVYFSPDHEDKISGSYCASGKIRNVM
jgi:hypothetical protein